VATPFTETREGGHSPFGDTGVDRDNRDGGFIEQGLDPCLDNEGIEIEHRREMHRGFQDETP
jgi:hypothetical protein